MTTTQVAVIFAVLAGILARTVLPYLIEIRDNPETTWDRKFLVPAAITLLIAVITSPFVFAAIPPDVLNATLSFQALIAIFVAAWGATDAIRLVQKALERPAARSNPTR